MVLFEDITDRKLAEAKINQLARYDSLTGLPNRALFRDQLDDAISNLRRRGPLAIHFIDLDEFKQVNDTLGHPCGDELLCAVADRLRNAVRASDIVARFGGDEFVILQYPLAHPKEAATVAERLVATLAEPFRISGHEVVIGASIGIALAPRDGSDADLLLKNADMALYRAKSDGRRAWRFFEHGMDVLAQARRNLQLDLRSALASNAFNVHYQPLLNMRTKRISTCEALMRWPHPGARHDLAGRVHSRSRGDGADRRDRRPTCCAKRAWSAPSGPATCASPSTCRRSSSVAATSGEVVREALAAARLPAEPARDRDHRVGVPQRHRAHASLAAGAAGHGRAHLARRFRHRLLEPEPTCTAIR